MKTCTVCNIEKTFEEFSPCGTYKGVKQYRPSCKKCRNIELRSDEDYQEKRRINQRTEKYRTSKRIRNKTEKYRAKDRIRCKRATPKRMIQRKKRYKTDIIYKLKCLVRSRLLTSIKLNGFPKLYNTIKYIGCDYSTLKSHIEAQFKPGMTWENHGEWEIDHVIPLASATSEEQLLKLSHYTNLQPLWQTENRQKSDSLPEDLIKQ